MEMYVNNLSALISMVQSQRSQPNLGSMPEMAVLHCTKSFPVTNTTEKVEFPISGNVY